MRIIYKRVDGGVSVVIPTGEVSLDVVLAKDIPLDATDIKVVQDNEIPSDRTYRGAWDISAGAITTNMPKARVIHVDKLRARRAPILAKLDIEWMRYIAKGETQLAAAVEAKRQALRDMPQTIAADVANAKTPEQLKAIIPQVITDNE